MHKKIIAIVGPTASGKTAVGIALAKEFNGEIVSADSRQVFRGLDLGTGKDLAEYDGIKYHLIDVAEPEEDFNLFKYLELARAAIEDIFSRGKVPIIVGGTGLYIQALVEGFELKSSVIPAHSASSGQAPAGIQILDPRVKPEDDRHKRDELEKLTIEQLQNILKKLDIKAYESLSDQKNQHRLIRAIERAQSGEEMIRVKPDWEALQIAIDLPREELNKRIDKRVDDRFEKGMLEEAENLLKSGVNPEWLFGLGLEYKIMTSFLISNFKFQISNKLINSKIQKAIQHSKLELESFEAMKQSLKLRSHQYAKRQMTWFKRFPEIKWEKDYKKISELARGFLKN